MKYITIVEQKTIVIIGVPEESQGTEEMFNDLKENIRRKHKADAEWVVYDSPDIEHFENVKHLKDSFGHGPRWNDLIMGKLTPEEAKNYLNGRGAE